MRPRSGREIVAETCTPTYVLLTYVLAMPDLSALDRAIEVAIAIAMIIAKTHPRVPRHTKNSTPPAQNQCMQEMILGELVFARTRAGPVFALARIQENTFEELL